MSNARLVRWSTIAGAAGVVGATRAWRGWSTNPDATGGDPLHLPAGEDITVPAADGGSLAVRLVPPTPGVTPRPLVVLAHGWTADRRVWGPTVQRLARRGHPVAVWDQRGHGASRAGSAGLRVAVLGDDLRDILDALDARGAILGGHSMGGMTVMSYVTAHPDHAAARVAGLALVGTAAGETSFHPQQGAISAAVVGSAVATRLTGHPVLGPFLVRGSVGRKPALAHLRATATSFASTDAAVRAAFVADIAVLDLIDALGAVDLPTVVVSGTRDLLLLHRLSRRIVEVVPNSRLEVVPGAGHQLVFEAPDRLAAVISSADRPATATPTSATPPTIATTSTTTMKESVS